MRPGFELGKGPFRVRAARLAGLAGTLSFPTQPEHVFAHELSGRIRVIAGLDQLPNLLHSEAWPDSRGTRAELKKLRGRLRCGPDDAIAVVWGPEEDVVTACEEIRLRYVDAIQGVPNETRQPFADGSTDFERILPGPDRMYPDTDSPPTRVTRDRVARLAAKLPERPWDRERRYADAGVPASTAHFLIRRGGAVVVDRLAKETGASVRDVAFLFGEKLKGLRRASVPVNAVPEERWRELLRAFVAIPVLKQAWELAVLAICESPGRPVADLLAERGFGTEPPAWRAGVPAALAAAREKAYRKDDAALVSKLALATLMPGLLGRVPASAVSEEVSKALPEVSA